MRVNIYAEEMPDQPRLQIIEKTIEGETFTALRIYLELPVTRQIVEDTHAGAVMRTVQVKGPFMHTPDDDDSAAVTFWGKRDLRDTFRKAIQLLDQHYADRSRKIGQS
jgi:hypothetical protein